MAFISRPPAPNAWSEGAWAEVMKSFGAVQYDGTEGLPFVLIQPQNGRHVVGTEPLADFQHPEKVVYVFGPDMGHLQPGGVYDHKVYIPQLVSHVTLWSHQAAAIILYDRMLKNGDPR